MPSPVCADVGTSDTYFLKSRFLAPGPRPRHLGMVGMGKDGSCAGVPSAAGDRGPAPVHDGVQPLRRGQAPAPCAGGTCGGHVQRLSQRLPPRLRRLKMAADWTAVGWWTAPLWPHRAAGELTNGGQCVPGGARYLEDVDQTP